MSKSYRFPIFLLAATVLGAIFGGVLPDYVKYVSPLGDIFTRLLFMIVPALVFFSIASSFANIGSVKKLGKWGGKIIGGFLVTTTIATVIGLIVGLFMKPGKGLTIEQTDLEEASISSNTFISWIPENAFGALSSGDIIQIVILAMIIGMAVVVMSAGTEKDFLGKLLNSGQALFITITKYIMYVAPFGIFALIAGSVSAFKGSLLSEMASFLSAFTIAFIIQVVLVYFLLFWIVTRLNPFKLTANMLPAIFTAFGTVSSAGTMPVTLTSVKKAGVKDEIAEFGIPLGVTFNMDSMGLQIPMYVMLGMYALDMSPTPMQLVQFVLLGIVFSIGTAGVPGGGLAVATILVGAFNLPIDIVGWIAAVFVYLDLTGTVMNIYGDSVVTTAVAKSEGQLDLEKYNRVSNAG